MYQNVSIFTTFCSYLNNFLRKIALIQSTLKLTNKLHTSDKMAFVLFVISILSLSKCKATTSYLGVKGGIRWLKIVKCSARIATYAKVTTRTLQFLQTTAFYCFAFLSSPQSLV